MKAGGLVLTNRHVAEPWWNDSTAATRSRARATRRGSSTSARSSRATAIPSTSSSRARSPTLRPRAAAGLAGRGQACPCCRSSRRRSATCPASRWWWWAIPTGLEAILAKAESGVVRRILESHGTDSERVTLALSRQGLIRPSTTQGHIGDITRTDIVFDAPSAQGGSGGPVFNKFGQVIAVEYAVLQKFGGNSFGIPIAYARELLAEPRARARTTEPRRPVLYSWPVIGLATAPGPRRDRQIALLLALVAAAFRLPRLGLPGRGGLRRGLSRQDRPPIPAGREPHGVGASADGEAPHRDRGLALRLQALGLAAAAGPGRDRARARLLLLRAARAGQRAGGRSWPRCAALRRRLPRAEPHGHDEHLRRAVPAHGRAVRPACRAQGARCPSRGCWRARPLPGPRPLHALDEPLGLGLPGPARCWSCGGSASSGRASWP